MREDAEASTAEGTEDTPAAEAFITELEVVTAAPPPILMSDTLGEDDFLFPPDSRLEFPAGTVSTTGRAWAAAPIERAAGCGAAAAIMAIMPMAGAGAML